jgi:hypothetical protein
MEFPARGPVVLRDTAPIATPLLPLPEVSARVGEVEATPKMEPV